MKLHGFHTMPGIYQSEKTTIKQGEIVREKIWKDTWGNELEKIHDKPPKFIVKKPVDHYLHDTQGSSSTHRWFFDLPSLARLSNITNPNHYPQTIKDNDDNLEDLIAFMIFTSSLLFLFLSAFSLGYSVALYRKARKPIEIEMPNLWALEPESLISV
jgi:hypothetical protein